MNPLLQHDLQINRRAFFLRGAAGMGGRRPRQLCGAVARGPLAAAGRSCGTYAPPKARRVII